MSTLAVCVPCFIIFIGYVRLLTGSYKVKRASITPDFFRLREPRCLPLRTNFILLFLSLALCFVLFPSTGTLKVQWKHSRCWNIFLTLDGTAWNTGACLFMTWVGLGCLLQCINSIVWNNNMVNRAPVYCDICKTLLYAFKLKSSPENSCHPLSFTPQQSIFKSRLMLQYLLVHFALTAASTRLLR